MKRVLKLFVLAVLLLVGNRVLAQKNHEYVDLGLPSGTLWATCNVGANKPEDFGNYYAWGETQTKTTYYEENYKFWKSYSLTRYCSTSIQGYNDYSDKLTTLQSSDDPATVNWGNAWRTPSEAQWEELLQNTTNKWTTRNGVNGRLFTSKKNGQTLFLPAAGTRYESELCRTGISGYYWSRTLNPYDSWYAKDFSFGSDGCGICEYANMRRFRGFSIRPVRK